MRRTPPVAQKSEWRDEPRQKGRVLIGVSGGDRGSAWAKGQAELLLLRGIVEVRPPPHEAGFSGHVKESKVTCRRLVRDHANEVGDLKCNGPRADYGGDCQMQRRQVPGFGLDLARHLTNARLELMKPAHVWKPELVFNCGVNSRLYTRSAPPVDAV